MTGSDDGHVFVLDGRPSKDFTPLGHISMSIYCLHGDINKFIQSHNILSVVVVPVFENEFLFLYGNCVEIGGKNNSVWKCAELPHISAELYFFH